MEKLSVLIQSCQGFSDKEWAKSSLHLTQDFIKDLTSKIFLQEITHFSLLFSLSDVKILISRSIFCFIFKLRVVNKISICDAFM